MDKMAARGFLSPVLRLKIKPGKSMKNLLFIMLSCFLTNSFALTKNLTTPIIKPDHLNVGDTVGLISSASRVPENQQIQLAKERLEALGLKVQMGKYVYGQKGYFSATDEQRAADLNDMFSNPEIKGIIELRGGWGTDRILHLINYQTIQMHPKILVGFSDITALLLAIHAKTGLITFHGPLAIKPWPDFTVQYFKRVLFDGSKVIYQNPHEVDKSIDIIQTADRIQTITPGKAVGRLLGGNLTVLTSMLGSSYLPQWQGSILFVEDVGEDIYKIDRMLTQLEMAGVLKQISGFVFGKCTGCKPSSALNPYASFELMQILEQHIKPLRIPSYFGAMIGHEPKIFTLGEGSLVEMNAETGTLTLLEIPVK
jgi:muramoyltetrapeptide carboxypeptidase